MKDSLDVHHQKGFTLPADSHMNSFVQHFGQWVIRYRWWVIIGTLLLVLIVGGGMQRLFFVNDSRIFFSKDNPQLQALETLENTYTKDETVFFALAPKNGNVFTRETLAALEELTDLCWKIPHSSRVDSIANFQHTQSEDDELIVEDLVNDARNLSDADLGRIKKIALSEPLLVNRLISASGAVSGINVNIIRPGKSIDETPEVAAFARVTADEFRKNHPDIDLHLTGGIMIDTAFGEASQEDMTTLVPLMFLVLVIVMAVALRSITGTLSTLLVVAFSMATGLGMAGWLKISLNPASANAPTIILTLAVADSIHLLVTMFHQMRQGQGKLEAIVESLRVNMQPVFLTSVTTAIGFLTMNFSDAPPFRDLGNVVAVGIMAAFVYSVLFLPAVMAVVPVRVKPSAGNVQNAYCDRLAVFVMNRYKPLFWITLAFILAIVVGISRIELNDNFIEYFDHRYEFRRATDYVEENLTGFDIIDYSLNSGETGGINDPKFLTTVEKFAEWYRKQPKVVHVNTLTDTIKRLNKNMHADDPAYYRTPMDRELAAQYLLLYEMSLPFGLDLNNQINVDKSSLRITITLADITTKELRQTDTRAREWLRTNAPETMFTYGTGLSIMFAHISERNINSMLGASFGALVLISAILVLALRTVKLGMISLIPNLAPAFMAFGIWGIIVGQVGLAISVLVALTLGIVVDDTVHFMSKYLRARREYGMSSPAAVRYAFNTVGTALWVTTATLVAGFMVLSLSGFKVNSDIGLMTAITISLALALDFLFLPALLIIVEEKSHEAMDVEHSAHLVPAAADCKRRDA